MLPFLHILTHVAPDTSACRGELFKFRRLERLVVSERSPGEGPVTVQHQRLSIMRSRRITHGVDQYMEAETWSCKL